MFAVRQRPAATCTRGGASIGAGSCVGAPTGPRLGLSKQRRLDASAVYGSSNQGHPCAQAAAAITLASPQRELCKQGLSTTIITGSTGQGPGKKGLV